MRQYCYRRNPVRLACLIHATSVRSEPESNSQKKEFELLHTNIFTVPCLFQRDMLKHQLSNINAALLEALLNLSRGNGWIVYQKTFGLRKGVF